MRGYRLITTLIPLLLVFLFTFGIRLYWINQKQGMNVDEGLSIAISSFNKYMLWSDNYEDGRTYSGKELRTISLWENPSFRNAVGDVYRLHHANPDTPHTNLYYSFLRLWFAGRIVDDYRKIISGGTGLNLLFFTTSFIVMFYLLKLLFENTSVVLAGLLLCFLNTGSISNTLLLRPYQLQETALIVATYFCVLYRKKIVEGDVFNRWQDLTLLASVGAFTLLSGYFSLGYAALLWCLILLTLLTGRKTSQVGFFIAVALFSVALAQMLYTNYLYGIIHGSRGQEALGVLFTSTGALSHLKESLTALWWLAQNHVFYWPTAVCLAVAIAIQFIPATNRMFALRNKESEIHSWYVPLFLVVAALAFSAAVLYLAPYKMLRYVMPVFPLIALSHALVLHQLKKVPVLVFASAMVAISLVYALDPSHIENLSLEKPEIFVFTSRPDVPVLILNMNYWKYADMIPYLADAQRYEFPASEQALKARIAELQHAFVVLERENFPALATDRRYTFQGPMNDFDLYEILD
jgi:hypothetical protein